MPAIEGLAGAGVPISADTFSVEVARRALAAGAVAVNDISGGSDEMFELVAESGCGYVLMHIEGPPRVDRPAVDHGDIVEHLLSWFGGRVERARGLGVGEEQIAIDPGLDFDLSTEQDLEILRRLGELGDLGLPLYVSLSRKDFIGAVLAGSWEDRLPASEREWGTVAAVALAVGPAPTSSASTTAAPCRRSELQQRSGAAARSDRLMAKSLLGDPMGDRDRPSPPRRPDRRRELRARAFVEDGRDPGLSRSGPGRGARPGRHRPPLLTPARGARGGRHLQPRDHKRHRVRQEPRLQPPRPRRHRRRRQASRALPLPDQGPRPGPGAEARRAATPGPARGDLRRRHPARGAARDPPPQQPRPHQPRHAPRRAAAQPPQLGRLPRQPRMGRRRRGPHLPGRLRLPRRQRPAAAAPGCPRLRLRAALPARLGDDRQPGRARRAPGRRAVRGDLRRRRPAAPGARSRCGTRR